MNTLNASGRRRTTGDATPASGWLIALALPLCGVLYVICTSGVPLSVRFILAVHAAVLLSLNGWAIAKRKLGLAIFLAFWFVYVLVAPTVQISTQRAAWGDHYLLLRTNDVVAATSLLTTFTAAVAVAYLTRRPTRHTGSHDEGGTLEQVEQPHYPRALAIGGFVLLSLLIALSPLSFAAAGGFSGMFVTRSDRTAALAEAGLAIAGSGASRALVTTLPAALAVASTIAFARAYSLASGSRLLLRGGLLLGLASVAIFANPLSNTRLLSFAALGGIFFSLFPPRSRHAMTFYALSAFPGFALLYPLADYFRNGEFQAYGTGGPFTTEDFDGFQQVINGLSYASDHGHSYGLYTISAILFFVPRSVWPQKQTPASLDVASDRGYAFTNLSLPLPVEAYIELGIAGVFASAIIVAVILHTADRGFALQARGGTKQVSFAILAGPYLLFAAIGLLRGPLGANVPVYGTVLALLWILHYMSSRTAYRP